MPQKLKIGWFSTGRDRAALDLLSTTMAAVRSGELNVDIAYVFVNREFGETQVSDEFINQAISYGIPTICLSSSEFKKNLGATTFHQIRNDFDAKVAELISEFEVEFVVMAGYMLILSETLCETFNFINLHPALPNGPIGTWQEVINTLIYEKAEHSGIMMHLVTADLDRGPAVSYCSFPIHRVEDGSPSYSENSSMPSYEARLDASDGFCKENGLLDMIRRQQVVREKPLIIITIGKFANREIQIIKRGVIQFGKPLSKGLDLTAEINNYLNKYEERTCLS